MKIKLAVSEDKYENIANILISKGFQIDENADFTLMENGYHPEYLIAKKDKEFFRLKVSEITHIESFAHEIIAYTDMGSFYLSIPLKKIINILDPSVFIRISKSVIISVNHIKSIKPVLTQKFIITMTNNAKVDVTRTYYYIFKEFLGI